MIISHTHSEIEYRSDLAGIDWHELIASLKEDDFHNGCTPYQMRTAFERSFLCCIAQNRGKVIGIARILSDGVSNAYLVDVWTYTPFRRQGIASKMIELLCERIPGQHIGTSPSDDIARGLYRKIGFNTPGGFFEKVVGTWLENESLNIVS